MVEIVEIVKMAEIVEMVEMVRDWGGGLEIGWGGLIKKYKPKNNYAKTK